jgi:hypothetical protein
MTRDNDHRACVLRREGSRDRLTRNLTDWNAFEKACVRHGVRLSAYTGGDLDLSTAEGAYYGGMETLRARRESAVKSARVREAQDREARRGRRVGGGQRWFGYTRIYANPDELNHKKRHILREEINPVEADAIRDAVSVGLAEALTGSADPAWSIGVLQPELMTTFLVNLRRLAERARRQDPAKIARTCGHRAFANSRRVRATARSPAPARSSAAGLGPGLLWWHLPSVPAAVIRAPACVRARHSQPGTL